MSPATGIRQLVMRAWSFAGREAIRGGDDALAHAGIARVVPGIAEDDKLAAGPILRKPPWRDERGSEIEAAVNQDARDASKAARFAHENAVRQPGVVAPKVGDQAR